MSKPAPRPWPPFVDLIAGGIVLLLVVMALATTLASFVWPPG